MLVERCKVSGSLGGTQLVGPRKSHGCRPQDRKQWVDDPFRSVPVANVSVISVAGTTSNKGHYDSKLVGGVATNLTEKSHVQNSAATSVRGSGGLVIT